MDVTRARPRNRRADPASADARDRLGAARRCCRRAVRDSARSGAAHASALRPNGQLGCGPAHACTRRRRAAAGGGSQGIQLHPDVEARVRGHRAGPGASPGASGRRAGRPAAHGGQRLVPAPAAPPPGIEHTPANDAHRHRHPAHRLQWHGPLSQECRGYQWPGAVCLPQSVSFDHAGVYQSHHLGQFPRAV